MTTKLIYKDLSYKIIGLLFKVHGELGAGHKEKYYQKALSLLFGQERIKYQEQVKVDLIFQGQKIGRYFLDFLIKDKMILEIKSNENLTRENINQVYSYLRAHHLKLGIIANFTREGVKFKRIVNLRKGKIDKDNRISKYNYP